jgi:hypothetical protein
MAAAWDQLPGESAKAYAAFCLYRDQGPRRSLDEASRLYHSQPPMAAKAPPAGRRRRASGQIRLWAQRWNWSARAWAWDQELARVKTSQRLAAAEEMDERHVREAMLLQNKAVERLRQLRPEELKPRETVTFLVEAAKLERLARGEPTERVAEEHHFPETKDLSDDELARILASRPDIVLPGGPGAAPAPPSSEESSRICTAGLDRGGGHAPGA